MTVTPQAGYIVDPANPNGVIRDPGNMDASTALAQNTGTSIGQTAPNPVAPPPTTTVNVNTSPGMPSEASTSPVQTSNTPGASTTQGQPTGGLTMPTNGSVVDLLNMAGEKSDFASREVLAQKYGIQGYTGTGAQNTDLAKKYLEAYNANKGSKIPDSAAQASSALDSYFKENTQLQQQDPQRTFIDEYTNMNPFVKQMYDMASQILSPQATKQSFVDEFKQLQSEQGIEGLNTELMNIKNIMDGTEDDIRTEITKAGGFATESQVKGMVATRNRVLLKQAQVLSDQLAAKEDYIDHIMRFSELDRNQVDKDIDRKLGLVSTMADMQDKMITAARENYSNILKTVGFQGMSELFKNDPQGMSMAEQALGLPKGTFKNEAFLATQLQEDAKYQFIPGTDNQASGYFDPKTGKFTSYGKTGSGGGGGTTSPISSNPVLSQALTTILGSGTFTKQQQQNVINAINGGADPVTTIKNQAKNIMGQTLATNLSNNEKAKASIESLEASIAQYYAKGGNTNIFKGNYEDALAKMGTVSDPKLRELATEIESALQIYRNAVSGTAYSVQEGKAIASIFPGIDKTAGLNEAIIQGRKNAFESVINEAYGQVVGPEVWTQLQNMGSTSASTNTIPKGTMSNSQFVEKALTANGIKYEAAVAGAQRGEIPVLDNKTGELGYIPESEFNPSKYTRV